MKKTMLFFLLVSRLCYAAQTHPDELNSAAEKYVRLVLAVGEHDSNYVDAYYGPEKWREEVKAQHLSLTQIAEGAEALNSELQKEAAPQEEMLRLRKEYLLKQLSALRAYVGILQGNKLSFDEEAKALYDVAPPSYPLEHFLEIQKKIAALLPGKGALEERYTKFREAFIIPKEKLDSVLEAAIAEARKRTKAHMRLPDNETFTVEYVQGKSWGGYNWYKGGARSVIQINTDLPSYVDRAIDLACHEGYPGHHVYNALLEQHLVRERGWVEFTVYPLFSPQSLIAEGTANYGIEVAFSRKEHMDFEKKVLYPLAGLNPDKAELYWQIADLIHQLNYARNEVARGYLDGKLSEDQAVSDLMQYELLDRDRAQKSLKFIKDYRSYVINYNIGQDLVQKYVESRGGDDQHPEKRWQIFEQLISSPRLPSGLK